MIVKENFFAATSENREIIYKTVLEVLNNPKHLNSLKMDFLKFIGESFECDRCYIRTFNHEKDEFVEIDKASEYRASKDIESVVGKSFDKELDKLLKYFYKSNRSFIVKDKEKFLKENDLGEASNKALKENLNAVSSYSFPILKNKNLMGVFALEYTETKKELNEQEIDLLKILASQILNYIYKETQFKKNSQYQQKENLLRLIIAIIRSSLDINVVKKNIVQSVGQFFEADRCFIRLYSNQKDSFISLDKNSEYISSQTIKSVHNLDFQNNEIKFLIDYYKNKQEIIINNLNNSLLIKNKEKAVLKNIFNAYDIKSAVSMPILFNDEFKGVLVLHYVNNEKYINDEDLTFLRLITSHIAVALNHTELLDSQKREARKQKFFSELMSIVKSNRELDLIIRETFENLSEFLKINKVELLPIDRSLHFFEKAFRYDATNNIFSKIQVEKDSEFYNYIYNSVIIKEKSFCSDQDCKYSNKNYHGNNLKDFDSNTKAIEVRIKDNTYGVLIAHFDEKTDQCEEVKSILKKVADYLAISIRDSNLYTKSQFVANISHEFKTPLAIISSYTEELIQYEQDKQTSLKYLNYIKSNAGRLNNLIESILSLHLIELDIKDNSLFQETFDIQTITEAAIKDCKEKNTNIQIRSTLKSCPYIGNPALLQQAVLNLINNAVSHNTEDTAIEVFINEVDEFISINIKDYGSGIDEKHLSNIFERFYRVDKSRSTKQGGAGLGLSIVKLITLAHNGKVFVKSEVGQGSTFTICLPKLTKKL